MESHVVVRIIEGHGRGWGIIRGISILGICRSVAET
jgi:hypothetical protein